MVNFYVMFGLFFCPLGTFWRNDLACQTCYMFFPSLGTDSLCGAMIIHTDDIESMTFAVYDCETDLGDADFF